MTETLVDISLVEFEDANLAASAVPLDVFTSASIGNAKALIKAIKLDVSFLHRCNSGGWTALMYAAYYGHLDALNFLHSQGTNLHARNSTGHTALMLATMCGHVSVVDALIKCGSLLEVRDHRGWTAVFHAVNSRHRDVLVLLLDGGANANACDQKKGDSPLLLACGTGDVELVELLLEAGADPIMPDYRNTTPLALATQASSNGIANVLLKAIKQRDQGPASDGGGLSALLAKAGLSSFESLFEEQAVNLHEFLTLTDADLKECGVSKMGPRRKMTALIARWHSNAPLRPSAEHVYANKLQVEMQEVASKLVKTSKETRTVLKQLIQEQELRSSTESLVVEARARLHQCHQLSSRLARRLDHLYYAVLNADDYIPTRPYTHVQDQSSGLVATNDCISVILTGEDCSLLNKSEQFTSTQTATSVKGDNNDRSLLGIDESKILSVPLNNVELPTSQNSALTSQAVSEIKPVILQPQTSVGFEHDSSYLNYVDNDNGFNLDQEQLQSASSGHLAQVPEDYKVRSPQLHVPKLGQPLKECLEIVGELTDLSDPNIPRNTSSSDVDALSASDAQIWSAAAGLDTPLVNISKAVGKEPRSLIGIEKCCVKPKAKEVELIMLSNDSEGLDLVNQNCNLTGNVERMNILNDSVTQANERIVNISTCANPGLGRNLIHHSPHDFGNDKKKMCTYSTDSDFNVNCAAKYSTALFEDLETSSDICRTTKCNTTDEDILCHRMHVIALQPTGTDHCSESLSVERALEENVA